MYINLRSTDVSCGVYQLLNIFEYIDDLLACEIKKDIPLELVRATVLACTYETRTLPPRIRPSLAQVLFSDANRYKNGAKLAKGIKTYFPRSSLICLSAKNPNSGNRITTWLWNVPPLRDLERFYARYDLLELHKEENPGSSWARS